MLNFTIQFEDEAKAESVVIMIRHFCSLLHTATLAEEEKLMTSIADQIGFALYEHMMTRCRSCETARKTGVVTPHECPLEKTQREIFPCSKCGATGRVPNADNEEVYYRPHLSEVTCYHCSGTGVCNTCMDCTGCPY